MKHLYKFINLFMLLIVIFWSFSFWQELIVNTTWGCLTWVWNDCLIVEINPENPATPESIAQDVVVAATYYVWTVLTIVLLICWLWYVFASWSGKDTSKYKKWLIAAGIWAVLVRSAPAIVRLIQYIARW
jgi:hypothetical protein